MPQSGIRDNRRRGSVGDFLKNNITPESELLFLSAYFTVYAYNELRQQLNSISKMKFLFGEPTFVQQKNIIESRNFSIETKNMEEREKGIGDVDAYGLNFNNKLSQSAIARQCVEWIKKKVDIRSMVKPNFLHGKLYHIMQSNGREMSAMGSSNFTFNGLGFGDSKNIELNLVTDSNRDIDDLKEWFLELWNNKEFTRDVKYEVIKYLEQYYMENTPEFLYQFTLYHIFKDYLDDTKEDFNFDAKIGFYDTQIWNMLFDFQRDAVKCAINKLEKYNGCIIADSVGLGKTFEALAVIKYYELKRKKVLVLCPKRLGANWEVYNDDDHTGNILRSDRFKYRVKYHTDLGRVSYKLSTFDWSNFDLIVIDESHNFRNNTYSRNMSRYEFLFEKVIKEGRKTQVLMLSATPVNNKLTDLKNQIELATEGNDSALAEQGIKNIRYTLSEAQKIFNNWSRLTDENRKVELLIELLSGTDFFKLLDTLTIARSRKHIRDHFNFEALGGFPQRLKPHAVYTSIDTDNAFVSYEEINNIFESLNLQIFSPMAYIHENRKAEYRAQYDTKTRQGHVFRQEDRESHLIGMMKVNYLKRLESSINSFGKSISRLCSKIEYTINQYDKNQQHLHIDYVEDEYQELFDEDEFEVGEFVSKKVKIALRHIKPEWRQKLKSDLIILRRLENLVCVIDEKRDKKLDTLKKLIKEKVSRYSINGDIINTGNKKIIIFTAFSDTAEYIYNSIKEFCLNELRVHVGLVVGSGSCKTTFANEFKNSSDFNIILANFSPVSKMRANMSGIPQTGEIDILVATDCISEGQNLQDCDCVINYDIHWNPVKILQRFGRVDRISKTERKNANIKLVNFWATEDLNGYIKLNERVRSKMSIVDLSATGNDAEIIDEKEANQFTLSFREKQLLRMRDEVLDIEDLYDNVALTEFNFNDFRMDLKNFLDNRNNYFGKTPLGLYAVCDKSLTGCQTKLISDSGVIFCLKRKGAVVSRKSNPIEPFYLIYITNKGEIKKGYSNALNTLAIYRSLCYGKSSVFTELVDRFNTITSNAENMSSIENLLNCVINSIDEESIIKSMKSILVDRTLKAFTAENINRQKDSFDLVSFLVIM